MCIRDSFPPIRLRRLAARLSFRPPSRVWRLRTMQGLPQSWFLLLSPLSTPPRWRLAALLRQLRLPWGVTAPRQWFACSSSAFAGGATAIPVAEPGLTPL
eukprot:1347912-Prorocentrum_lima.AAC.1